MSESTRCPKCGIQLPADAPAGLCPKCLVQAGFESEPVPNDKFEPTLSRPASSGFEPPSVDELTGWFPQLEIVELLGKGGMGAVYKARQPGLDRLVAVKILPPEISHDPAFAERFQREARALARLNHPHIVAVYDFGEMAGLCYIVMEYVDGVNLRETIRTGTLTSAEALAIVPQICEALQFAHDEGIVHRDIKPENILIDKRGRVKIADFGLAKLLGQDASDHSLTATHQVMGTLRYMAPEQMQGSREVDHRADIYSLGVVFYELLTGELPMGKFAPPSKRVQVDVRLDEIVLRALEQDPEQRYQHASEVKTDVEIISRSPSAEILASKGSASGSDPAARQVNGPAIGLLVAGLLYWISIPFAFVALSQPSVHSRPTIQMNVLFSLGLVPLVAGTMLVLAGDRMKRLERRGFAIASCLLAIVLPGLKLVEFVITSSIGMALGDFVAAPLGLWALAILSRSDVKAAFDSKTRPQPLDAATVARPESAKDAAIGPHLIQGPADCLLLAAGIACVTACGVALWLGVSASLGRNITNLTNPIIRGNLIGMSVGLGIYSVFVGVAGLLMRQLRARLCVLLVAVIVGLFFPAVIALNVVMEFRNIPVWPVVIPLWLGMPAALWAVVRLFRDDVRRAFDAAAKQRAEQRGTEPARLIQSPSGENTGTGPVSLPPPLAFAMVLFFPLLIVNGAIFALLLYVNHWGVELNFAMSLSLALVETVFIGGGVSTALVRRVRDAVSPPGSPSTGDNAEQFPNRPKLVPVLATFNLVGAIVLMLVCATEEAAAFTQPVPRLWQVWEQVDAVLGFTMAAGMFAASIGLFLWKPWARKLTLGVCIFGLASFVFDAPYLGRFALPDAYAEIQWTVIAEGVVPDLQDLVTLITFMSLVGGLFVVGLTCLIGQLVYFTRPRVVAAFESPGEKHGKFIDRLFTGTGAVLGVLSVFGALLLLGVTAMFDEPKSTSDRTSLPPLGIVTNGIGVEFTVPAGQVATFEIVTRRDNETVPIPPHCAYLMAPDDQPVAGQFRWLRKFEEVIDGNRSRNWGIEILTAGGGRAYSEASLLPVELNEAVGARGIGLGLLEPNEESVHWGTADVSNLPANGLIGLRVTAVAHGLKSGGSGSAHIDWKKSRMTQSTSRRKLPDDAP